MRKSPELLNHSVIIESLLLLLGEPLWVKASGDEGDGEFLLDMKCHYYVIATRGFEAEVDPKKFDHEMTKFRDSQEYIRFKAELEIPDELIIDDNMTGIDFSLYSLYYNVEYADIEEAYLKKVRTQKAFLTSILYKRTKLYTDLINLVVSYSVAPDKYSKELWKQWWGCANDD